jgi:hypothetical protein
MKRALLAAPVALALGAVGALLSGPRAQPFPHAEHAGLFPTCVGCHAGAASGDSTRLVSVTAEGCAQCHDGAELEAVTWTPPRREPTNLAFGHGEHAEEIAEAGKPRIDCAGCHSDPGAPAMEVRLAAVENCIGCHAPGEQHLAYSVDCTSCHLPLVRAVGLSEERVATLPEMPNHDEPDFVADHGELAERPETCAICHARESCARCHVNADRLAPVAALGPDARVARLVADRAGEWPEPESHRRAEWAWAHGDVARESTATCANCHTQRSCEACHSGSGPTAIAALPRLSPADPRGVRIADVRPPGHTPGFATRHGTAAAAGLQQCSVCHTERQCADCHAGSEKPRFHAAGFVLRHGPEAFARDSECAACHSSETFCRDCHSGLGLSSQGRTGGAFHDAQPTWLLAHGLAARQDLESCTTCHEERSCLRCHSAKAGFRVSPHGPDFDPADTADKSQQSCGICHLALPEAARP